MKEGLKQYILVSFLVVSTNIFTGTAHVSTTAHLLILQEPRMRGYFAIFHVIFQSIVTGMGPVRAVVLSHFQQDLVLARFGKR